MASGWGWEGGAGEGLSTGGKGPVRTWLLIPGLVGAVVSLPL